jgi:serine O-acetyltransferase
MYNKTAQQPTSKTLSKEIIIITVLILSAIRLIPHWILYNFHRKNKLMKEDVEKWLHAYKRENYGIQFGFLYLMTFYIEYRNVFYFRIGLIKNIIKYLCFPLGTLNIGLEPGFAGDIGAGLIIRHGEATRIFARSIGKDCSIWQQVTIGRGGIDGGTPTIGNNVKVFSGAKIIGNIIIGDNVKIGANAVVVKDVPENCTVVGVPAYIVRKNGIKVREN